MLPSAEQLFKDADLIFQQDLAPSHTAKSTKSWLNDHGVGVLACPANSPDRNPIENLWDIVKRKMRNTYLTTNLSVMNLAATHYNCTSPMDYISHHTLHSHIPIHHHTNHTAVTNHSFALIASPHLHLIHPLTYKQHTYTHPLRSLVFPWLTFPSVFHSLSFRLLPGLLTLSPDRLLPALLTPPAYWLSSLLPTLTHCSASVYVSALSTLPSIPLFDICLSDPLFLLKKLHVDPFASVQSLHWRTGLAARQ